MNIMLVTMYDGTDEDFKAVLTTECSLEELAALRNDVEDLIVVSAKNDQLVFKKLDKSTGTWKQYEPRAEYYVI